MQGQRALNLVNKFSFENVVRERNLRRRQVHPVRVIM